MARNSLAPGGTAAAASVTPPPPPAAATNARAYGSSNSRSGRASSAARSPATHTAVRLTPGNAAPLIPEVIPTHRHRGYWPFDPTQSGACTRSSALSRGGISTGWRRHSPVPARRARSQVAADIGDSGATATTTIPPTAHQSPPIRPPTADGQASRQTTATPGRAYDDGQLAVRAAVTDVRLPTNSSTHRPTAFQARRTLGNRLRECPASGRTKARRQARGPYSGVS